MTIENRKRRVFCSLLFWQINKKLPLIADALQMCRAGFSLGVNLDAGNSNTTDSYKHYLLQINSTLKILLKVLSPAGQYAYIYVSDNILGEKFET